MEAIAMYTKARKQGRWFSRMANGNSMNRIFTWKTIRKKFLKKSKTSAKKYLHSSRQRNHRSGKIYMLGKNHIMDDDPHR